MRISDWSSDVCSSDLFWAYIREPRPHRWTVWGVALALTWLIFTGVEKYLIPYEKPKEQIIYFENWTADRSDAEIRADWVARAKETTRRNAQKRAEYQRFADSLGIEYDSAEADKVTRSEEHTSELQSLMRISYAVFCLKKKKKTLR